MPDYEKMYWSLFNAVTDAIRILQQAQRQAEEKYISEESPLIRLFGGGVDDEES